MYSYSLSFYQKAQLEERFFLKRGSTNFTEDGVCSVFVKKGSINFTGDGVCTALVRPAQLLDLLDEERKGVEAITVAFKRLDPAMSSSMKIECSDRSDAGALARLLQCMALLKFNKKPVFRENTLLGFFEALSGTPCLQLILKYKSKIEAPQPVFDFLLHHFADGKGASLAVFWKDWEQEQLAKRRGATASAAPVAAASVLRAAPAHASAAHALLPGAGGVSEQGGGLSETGCFGRLSFF